MSTPTNALEAERASVAYQLALTRLGVQTIAQALVLWQHVPATPKAPNRATWLRAVTKLILGQRAEATLLARAYYRLSRALWTGKTIADPDLGDAGTHTSLNALRADFDRLAGTSLSGSQSSPGARAGAGTGKPSSAGSGNSGSSDDDLDKILVEEIKHLKEQEAAAARAAEEEIQTALEALGPANLDKLLTQIDDQLPASEVDKLRAQAHLQAGARQAAAAERIAVNGARSSSWLMQEGDKRAIGYVRVSQTGTPCGWCAMLISRGVVYKSKASAEYADGDKYHDNCHCIAIPVYSREQFDSSDKFDLNRKYAEQWPQVTRGLGGKSAVSAWRRFIRTEQASHPRRT